MIGKIQPPDSALNLNDEKKTAGLGFQVKAVDWPFLILPGGVKGGNMTLLGPTGIDFGNIKIPGDTSSSLTNEIVDWSHNEMTFLSNTGSQLNLWVSRLTPAILVQSSSNSIRLLTGDVTGNTFDGSTITPRPTGPSYPKYIAFQSGGLVQTHILDQSPYTLPLLDQNWLLLWYGSNSHFVDTKKPLTYTHPSDHSGMVPEEYAYQADAPILIVFQNQPNSIKNPSEGGVELSFSSTAGFFSFSPLLGRDHLNSIETDSWFNGLPNEIIQRSQWWAQHLCDYPISANETYDYDEATDTAIISENFTFQNVCSGGIKLSPIPPMLGITKDTLNVTFSGPIADGTLNTEFGPYLGIENTDFYTWRVSALQKYVDANRILVYPEEPPPGFPTEIEQELESQVGEMIGSGHLAPWIFADDIPLWTSRGDIYWLNPADEIYHLIEIATSLPTGNVKTQLVNYIKSERNSYPPEDIYNLPLDEGTLRSNFAISGPDVYWIWENQRSDVFLKNVPLYNFYALAQYYKLTGEAVPSQLWQKALGALDSDMREQDWASFYWFNGFADRRDAVVNANRLFSGLVGFIRLSQTAGDIASEKLGRALLAKAAVLRLGMAEYPRYLYSANLIELPPSPDWQVTQTAGYWLGHLYNYNWVDGTDDARQVADLNQFGVYLYDHSGYMEFWQELPTVWDNGPCSAHLTTYRDMTPELARFLSVFAKNDVGAFDNLVKRMYPHWYAAFAEGTLGEEHNLSHPTDSFQIFMAEALIQGATPQELTSQIDISWLAIGDLFYLQKLAETIKVYRGVVWDDSINLSAVPRNQTIYLSWDIYTILPEGVTWQIEYTGPSGDQPSPIMNIPSTQRSFTLTGLVNGSLYTIIVKAMMGSTTLISSDSIKAIPMENAFFIPIIHRYH